MGGESTSPTRVNKAWRMNSPSPLVEVQAHGGHLTVTRPFAGVFRRQCAIACATAPPAPEETLLFAEFFCSISASDAATFAAASGSRNDSVPTATISAPARRRA